MPDAPGSVFPGLYDDTPGDQIPAQDISGVPLEPLISPDDPLAAGTGSSLSSVPEGAAEAGDAPEQIAGGDIPAPTQRKPRTAADRIAQLTKQYRHEQRARGDTEARLEETLAILRQQGEELKQLRVGRAQPRQAAQEAADALGLGAPGAIEGQAAPVTADTIRGIVSETFQQYEARRAQQDHEIRQMQASHETAFKEAAEEMPELLDTRSQARAYFDELYRTSPLKTLPDGPYQIALQVRGLLADDSRRSAAPERKLQAGVVVPAGAPVDANTSAGLRREYARLTDLRKKGNEDFQVYKRWRAVRDQLLRQPRR